MNTYIHYSVYLEHNSIKYLSDKDMFQTNVVEKNEMHISYPVYSFRNTYGFRHNWGK
jgi:hypothetical protein